AAGGAATDRPAGLADQLRGARAVLHAPPGPARPHRAEPGRAGGAGRHRAGGSGGPGRTAGAGQARPGPADDAAGRRLGPAGLVRVRPRWWPSLDRTLARRRSVRRLGTRQPSRKQLSRLLQTSHGITGSYWAGPVPSAGGLQALELYLVPLEPGWLGQGAYHYDRQGHCLARVVAEAPRPR